MQDLAILTGGTVVTGELGIDLPQVTLEHLGSARRVTVTKSHTTIVDGGGALRQSRIGAATTPRN